MTTAANSTHPAPLPAPRSSPLKTAAKASVVGFCGMLSLTAATIGVVGAGAAAFSAYISKEGWVQTPVDMKITKGLIAGGLLLASVGMVGAKAAGRFAYRSLTQQDNTKK